MPEWFDLGPIASITDLVQTAHCGATEIAFVTYNGAFYAFDNFCPHLGFPLDGETIQQDLVTCAWHRACFRLPEGTVVSGPCDSSLRMRTVEVRDQNLWVQID